VSRPNQLNFLVTRCGLPRADEGMDVVKDLATKAPSGNWHLMPTNGALTGFTNLRCAFKRSFGEVATEKSASLAGFSHADLSSVHLCGNWVRRGEHDADSVGWSGRGNAATASPPAGGWFAGLGPPGLRAAFLARGAGWRGVSGVGPGAQYRHGPARRDGVWVCVVGEEIGGCALLHCVWDMAWARVGSRMKGRETASRDHSDWKH
jgi:hypothetical protein